MFALSRIFLRSFGTKADYLADVPGVEVVLLMLSSLVLESVRVATTGCVTRLSYAG